MILAPVVLCSALAIETLGQGGAVKDLPATSTISDSAFLIQSDGVPYSNTASVRSVVQTHGDWILDLSGSKRTPANRSVLIDFGEPIEGTGPEGGSPAAPFARTFVNARFIASCHRTGYDVNMLNMLDSAEATCPLNITFDYGGNRYGIAMNSVSYAGTEDVTISCLSRTNQCNSWNIKPYVYGSSNGASSIGKLLKLPTKPNQSSVDLGNFNFSFEIGVCLQGSLGCP
jgi:hypothetical protein